MLEPYAVKVARTVLRGGKPERAYPLNKNKKQYEKWLTEYTSQRRNN
jgi:hypothetical protein